MTPTQLIATITPDLTHTHKGRDATIIAFMAALQIAIDKRKGDATVAGLTEIDWLYHAIQELRLVFTMDKNQVALRIAELKAAECDEEERLLREASVAIINAVGKALR